MAENGRLPRSELAQIEGTSRLIRADLVDQVNAWRKAFEKRFHKPLVITDAYREYEGGTYSQVSIFKARYTPQYLYGRPRKWWLGQWWYQRPYTAMAATPGTSNHGWATAMDLGSGVNSGYSDEWEWAVDTAPKFGFRWPIEWAQRAGEWWHFEDGRVVPVSNYIDIPGVDIPTPNTPTPDPIDPIDPEDDEVITFIQALYKRYLGRPGSTTEWANWAKTFKDEGIASTDYLAQEARFITSRAERASVVQAYQEILGRRPENEEVVTHWSDTETIKQVWDGIADSEEGRNRRK